MDCGDASRRFGRWGIPGSLRDCVAIGLFEHNMQRDLKDVFPEVFALPEHERAALARLLIESLDPPPEPGVAELWAEHAERRWLEIEAGVVQTIPWEEIRAKLLRR